MHIWISIDLNEFNLKDTQKNRLQNNSVYSPKYELIQVNFLKDLITLKIISIEIIINKITSCNFYLLNIGNIPKKIALNKKQFRK